jgi:hypothetical protein
MSMANASPSFFDAQEDASPDAAASNTPVDGVGATTPSSSNSSLGQRRLFSGTVDRENDDDNNDIVMNNRYLIRLDNQRQELDLVFMKQEEEEEGEGTSTCSAADFEELNCSNFERLEVLIKGDGDNNHVLVVKTLGKEVSVPKAPDDWKPDAPKVEKGQPEFINVDNPGGWAEYTFRSTTKEVRRSYKRANTYIMPYPLGLDLYQLMLMVTVELLIGISIIKNGLIITK